MSRIPNPTLAVASNFSVYLPCGLCPGADLCCLHLPRESRGLSQPGQQRQAIQYQGNPPNILANDYKFIYIQCCVSGIRIFPYRIQGQKGLGSRIRIPDQCCGSECCSRIPDPDFYPSRISDLGSRIPDPKIARKNLLSYFFLKSQISQN